MMTARAMPVHQTQPDAGGQSGAAAEGTPLAGSGGGAAASPRPVTRGETTPQNKAEQRVSIDWLNCTFPGLQDDTQHTFMLELGRRIGRPIRGVQGRGLFGFEHGLKMYCQVGSLEFMLGVLCWGGESQRGRWMLQIPGGGCKLVPHWSKVRILLENVGAKITRVDLAMDFLEGEHTVDDAVQIYRDGGFTNGGRPPTTSTAGDWLDRVHGRTLYVGKAANGKMLRVYEKGIQMGALGSKWVRFEVQLGNKDRCIPWKVLTEPASFIAGSYPALASMVAEAATRIPTDEKAAVTSLAHLLFHLKRGYGKSIDAALTYTNADAFDLIEAIRVVGLPSRLPLSAVDSGLSWERVTPSLREKEMML